jgi:hypothetical protein
LTDFINYAVCFTFGVMTCGRAAIAAVIMSLKEKAPRHEP